MEFSLGLQMDEETAKRVVSNQQSTTSTSFQGYSYNGKNLSFLTAKHNRMTKNDLKFNTEHDLENMNFELTEVEERVHKLLKLEHNTIDIINENIKLKEMCKFLKSNYEQDVDKIKQEGEASKAKLADLETKLETTAKELEHRSGESNYLLLSQQKRQKEFDELYGLLEEREKEVESANKYSEALLAEKKKLIGIIEQKDNKIETLAKSLYHKDQQLGQQLDDLNKIIRDLQDEKRGLIEGLKHKGDQLSDMSRKNAELKKELDALNAEYRKHFDASTRAANGNKEDELVMKQRELDNLVDEHENLKAAFDRLAKDYDELKSDSSEKEKMAAPANDPNTSKEVEQKNGKISDLQKELQKLKDQLDNKKDEHEELDSILEGMKKANKKAEDDNADKQKKIADLEDKISKLEDALKAANTKNRDNEKELGIRDKQIDLLKDELAKQADMLKDQITELQEKDKELQEAAKQKKAADEELEKAQKENNELMAENIDLKTNKGGFNTNVTNQFDDLKNALAQKDNKVNTTEYELKKLNDNNKDLANENNKLKKQLDDLRKKVKDLTDLLEDRDRENNDLKDDNHNLSNEIEDLVRDITDLNNKVAKLEEAIKALKADDKVKQQLVDLQVQTSAEHYKILKALLRVKIKGKEALDILTDTEGSDANIEEAEIQKLPDDQYKEMIIRLLSETDGVLTEVQGEAETSRRSIRNLINEKSVLLEKMQELEEKYVDVKSRHDNKTDQLAKLSTKAFILTIELDRLDNKA